MTSEIELDAKIEAIKHRLAGTWYPGVGDDVAFLLVTLKKERERSAKLQAELDRLIKMQG